jgi:hypothetical protein
MSASEYPFGVAPKDPFDPAHCPACRAQIGPRMHACRSCFATYDLAAAESELLSRPEARASRLAQLALALLGIVGSLAATALSGAAAPLAAAGLLATLCGGIGWWLFPRWPAFFARLAAVLLVGAALAVALAALQFGSAMPLDGRSNGRFGTSLLGVALATLIGLAVTSWRGVATGMMKRKLHVVARPAVVESEGYR